MIVKLHTWVLNPRLQEVLFDLELIWKTRVFFFFV